MEGLLRQTKLFAKRHGSTILTCMGGVGLVATSIMAVKATPKAMKLIDEAKEEKGEELTKWETVRIAGPTYIPSIAVGIGTMACIFGANVMNKRQQASLMSAYALVERSYGEYKAKLKELYGEEAHQNVVNAIAVEKAENIGVNAPGFVTDTSLYIDEQCGEPRLFYDEYGQRYFEATLEQVISAEYHLNRNYVLRGFTVLNEFYEFLGLEPTDYGSEIGWVINDDGTFWIEFDHRRVELEDGLECYIIEMPFGPSQEWKEYY